MGALGNTFSFGGLECCEEVGGECGEWGGDPGEADESDEPDDAIHALAPRDLWLRTEEDCFVSGYRGLIIFRMGVSGQLFFKSLA